ncbi:ssDNA-binding protein, partial [Streptococcus canis]|uniref:ssDNA-binding protein n=1 Tax=Streptococcus canis TaxID=1329 RepID=UPI000C3F4D1D
ALVSLAWRCLYVTGNKGIACGLNNLQKLRDGEPLGGRTRAEDDFATDDDDDFLN